MVLYKRKVNHNDQYNLKRTISDNMVYCFNLFDFFVFNNSIMNGIYIMYLSEKKLKSISELIKNFIAPV